MATESEVMGSYRSLTDGTESVQSVTKNSLVGVDGHSDYDAGQNHEKDGTTKLWEEVTAQCNLAWPISAANFLSFSFIIVSSMFVGHLGALELSSASLGNSFASVSGFTIMIGLAGALDTLCGQAYGAKKYHLMGLYMQASMIITLSACLPIICIWLNMETLLLWLGQDPEISRLSASYLRYLMPGLISAAISQPLIRYLQSQSIVLPIMICSLGVAIFHPVLCYVIIYRLKFGYHGGALATMLSYWFVLILLLSYVIWSGIYSRTWDGFKLEAFSVCPMYLRLAIPSVAMLCLEYWSYEILVFLSGLLPNPELELSLLSICLNTGALTFMIPFGLGVAASTRVSNELGAKRPGAAKLAVKVVGGLAVTQACVISCVILLLRNTWGHTFSNVEEVVSYVAEVIPLLALSSFMDGIQGVLSGVVRGCGRQDLGAFINLGAFYVIGLPTAFLLAFHFKLNGKGLWMGIMFGLFVQMMFLLVTVLRTNWEKMVENALSRIRKHPEHEPLLPTSVEGTQALS